MADSLALSAWPARSGRAAALLVAPLLLGGCVFWEPTPAQLRMQAEEPFTVRGVDTNVDRVWATADATCGSDWRCAADTRDAYRSLRHAFLYGSRIERTSATAALRLYTADGVTDWRGAWNAARAEAGARLDAMVRLLAAPPERHCTTRIGIRGRKATTECRSR